jgi:murein DD-endopeptidase MepM/ murein hydrolase activator NlpD
MGNFVPAIKRILFVVYLIGVHLLLVYLLIDKYIVQRMFDEKWKPQIARNNDIQATPFPTPVPESTPIPAPSESTTNSQLAPAGPNQLLIPVEGVTRDKLIDTFLQARSEGRMHDAIDIPAPLGTPVIAAADGEIVKFHDSAKGGITIYQLSSDRKYFFYYAHLQRRDERIYEGQFVRTGTVIGYVGDTGNAGTGNTHLHFQITVVTDPKRFWEGTSIDPYKILRGEAELR